jgi:hypothetical protein
MDKENLSSESQKKEFKTHQEEISTILSELKDHYFLGKYFVDPDGNFLSLLEKIIVRIFFNGLYLI